VALVEDLDVDLVLARAEDLEGVLDRLLDGGPDSLGNFRLAKVFLHGGVVGIVALRIVGVELVWVGVEVEIGIGFGQEIVAFTSGRARIPFMLGVE
jgi:hypothetical protein